MITLRPYSVKKGNLIIKSIRMTHLIDCTHVIRKFLVINLQDENYFHMTKHLTTVLIIILSFASISCNDNTPEIKQDISQVSYGTSFGECIGYCVKSLTITEDLAVFTKEGWNMYGKLPDVQIGDNIYKRYLNALENNIDFDDFTKLDSTIGCPDCADGGAEWIEIQKGDSIYKVTFEYGNAPLQLAEILGYLHTYFHAFDYNNKNNLIDFNNRVLIDQKGTVRNDLCTDSCNSYMIEVVTNNDTNYYYDIYLDQQFKQNDLDIIFNATIHFDTTTIYNVVNGLVSDSIFNVVDMHLFDLKRAN